jgi:hypothetical protein
VAPIRSAAPREAREMDNALTIVGVLVVWYVLQMWVLPKLGVPT